MKNCHRALLAAAMLVLPAAPGLLGFHWSFQAVAAEQNITVTGTVTGSGEPIIGATVRVEGTSLGAATDIDGNFSLQAPADATIIVSYVGYQTAVIHLNGKTQLDINLEESAQALDEVVVVGYGVQKKKLVTGATVQVKGGDVAKLNTTSALGALQSQTPGVNITSNNGQPGAGYKVNIRGMGTVGNSEPLYVIDGVAGGDINMLNPNDIESVDVLKDAASAAIYGARAANGVILVTTKQGRQGKIEANFDAYVGWQDAYKMPTPLTANQAIALANETDFRNNVPQKDWASLLGPRVYNMLQNGWRGTNWLEKIRNKHALTQNYSFGLNGGSETSRFSLGFAYTSQDGIFGGPKQSKYDRYTFRINSDHTLLKGKDFDIIKIGENVNFFYSTNSGIQQRMHGFNDIETCLTTTPLMPMYNAAGDLFSQDDKAPEGWLYNNEAYNPMLKILNNTGNNRERTYGLQAQAYLDIQPIKNLRYHGAFSFRMTNKNYRSLISPYNGSSNETSDAFKVMQEADNGHKITVENTISYKLPEFGKNAIDVLIGQSYEKTACGEWLRVQNSVPDGSQLPTMLPDMDHAWLDNAGNLLSSTVLEGHPWPDWSILSYFGRANYAFDEKYLLTAIIRADGSSNFAKGHRWGYFPSVSVGWVLSNEKFMETTRGWLDMLKLRASWGQNGNQDIANFQYLSPVAFDPSHVYNFGETVLNTSGNKATGAFATTLANKDVTWEKSEQWNVGIDAYLFNARMQIALDWYKKSTKDWLVQAPVLDTAGTSAPFINGGDVENTGVELGLGWNDHIGEFRYGGNINFAYNHNEVTRIANPEGVIHGDLKVLSPTYNEMYRAQVGQPIGYFWGYQTAGVFQTQEEIDAWRAAGNGFANTDVRPGDLKYVDRNHDGEINEKDKTRIGNPNPKFRLGINLNFGWRGFDLSATCSGSFGHQVLFGYRSNTTYAMDRWHGTGTSNRFGNDPLYNDLKDTQIENADYFRFQNITLGYDFKQLWRNCPFQQLRFYISGQNLWTITKYHGLDPEVGFGGSDQQGNKTGWMSGIDLGSYPTPRTILLGVNIKY